MHCNCLEVLGQDWVSYTSVYYWINSYGVWAVFNRDFVFTQRKQHNKCHILNISCFLLGQHSDKILTMWWKNFSLKLQLNRWIYFLEQKNYKCMIKANYKGCCYTWGTTWCQLLMVMDADPHFFHVINCKCNNDKFTLNLFTYFYHHLYLLISVF